VNTPGISTQQPSAGPPAPPPVPRVIPAPGTRLEQLLAQKQAAEDAVAAAKERLALITDGIKAEVYALGGGAKVVDVAGSAQWAGLRLRWHDGSWYVPAETLRSRYPGVWNELQKQQKGSWQLHPLGGGQ